MNHEAIKQIAQKRMRSIEDRFADYIPPEVQQYYLLLDLLDRGVSSYIQNYGLLSLDVQSCEEGKELARFEKLNAFECDCIAYLNDHIQREEESYARRKQISLISHR